MTSLAIPVDEIEQMKGLATLFPGEPAELFAKMLFGRGLGMGPAQSLSQIDFVKGKCELTANAQASRLRAYVGPWGERYDYAIAELTGERCVLRFWRRWPGPEREDEMLGESSFSMDDARTVGIASGMYSKYARNMLLSRAMSNGVAWFAPETTYGVRTYAVGEIDPGRDHAVPAVLTEGVPGGQPELAPVADVPQLDSGAAEHPTREDYAELKRLTTEKNLSDAMVGELADDAGVPDGGTLKARLKAASRSQVRTMIENVEFVEGESAAGVDEQQTIDGSVAPENAPASEGVAA